MKLTLAEPRFLKDSITIISDLVTEAKFTVTKDALSLIAMDPANVAMIDYKLLSSCFTEYDIKEDTTLSVDLANLKQILRRAGSNDMITLELAENRLKLKLKGKTTRTFTIPLLEAEDKEQKVPDLSFPASVETNASILTDAIEDIDIVAESVSFEIDQNTFVINGESDLSKATVEIKPDEDTKFTVEGQDKIRAKYSVEYLKKILPASKLSDRVTVRFSKDYPLKLEYTAVDKVQLNFILAPRVEND